MGDLPGAAPDRAQDGLVHGDVFRLGQRPQQLAVFLVKPQVHRHDLDGTTLVPQRVGSGGRVRHLPGQSRRPAPEVARTPKTLIHIDQGTLAAAQEPAEYDQVRSDRDASYVWLAIHDEDWRRVLDVWGALLRAGRMR